MGYSTIKPVRPSVPTRPQVERRWHCWPKYLGGFDAHSTVRQSQSLVEALQRQLVNKYGSRIAINGQFSDETRQAVIAFQQAHGLTPNGSVGPDTWTALLSGTGSANAKNGNAPSRNERVTLNHVADKAG
jgi:peptidoglycan hydrolase-like protein with peptidoglycan-binding domain